MNIVSTMQEIGEAFDASEIALARKEFMRAKKAMKEVARELK